VPKSAARWWQVTCCPLPDGALYDTAIRCKHVAMTKRIRDKLLVVRVAAPLRQEVEAAADEEGVDLSVIHRRILLNWAEKRLAARAIAEVAA
jgi:hypothetical protein